MTRDDVIRIATEIGLCRTQGGVYRAWIDAGESSDDLEAFTDQILEEVAQEIAKLPFGDTASSFAVFVRQMKVNRSDNESGRSPLSATSTSAE